MSIATEKPECAFSLLAMESQLPFGVDVDCYLEHDAGRENGRVDEERRRNTDRE